MGYPTEVGYPTSYEKAFRVILLRARNKVRQEISDEQYGFMKDRGTRNAIYMMKLMAERAIEMQRDCTFVLLITRKRLIE